mmetsp:Transcript_14891/g.24400  ORF Transcript_14891/g.24400 Transcript_14891/m.24400 type:complete len:803 (+) Transcript_14891:59-2467(+)
MKFRVLGITSLLCVCKASTDAASASVGAAAAASESAIEIAVVNDADGEKIDETPVSDAADTTVDAAVDAAEPSNNGEPLEETDAIEGEGHHEKAHHELSEAFEIMDENRDGVLQKEEVLVAIGRSEHNTDVHPEEYADNLIPKEKSFDKDTFTEMINKASAEEIKEGEVPSLNQQMAQLASDVLVSYYQQTEPPYEPNIEDFYNPHNMTYEELEYHLYEWEEDAVGHVSEYYDLEVFNRMRNEEDDWYKEDEEHVEEEQEEKKKATLKDQKHHDDGSKTKVEMRKSNTNHYLNLSNDVAHVVEFYAPWCPHCQHFKWEYIEIATETRRRTTTTPVEFHAVSCDVYWRICSTYGVDGFPTIIGWKKGDSFEKAGIVLNDDEEIHPDLIGEMLELDLANEAVEVYEWEFETEKERIDYEKEQAKKAKKAAMKKTSWHQYTPHTHNDRYHNAALSFAFAVKTQLFQTLTADGKMEPKRKNAMVDFLNLMEWATPPSWNLRTGFVKELQWSLDLDAISSRGALERVIDSDVDKHRSNKHDLLWGYVDPKLRTSWAGGLLGPSDEQLAKDDKKWSNSCTHLEPAKGFTCGLWNLFHILTIGSSKPEHQVYGFHRGYFVSPHHVAETIRNFVEHFFSCSVCRTHYLEMYDNCGHDHCTRLKSEINMGTNDGSDKELAMWLWEVHNDVNARLMKEAAQRQNRNVTQEETVASMFPTKKMCPDCWLNENMTKWDNATVFKFLDEWYWPADLPPSKQFKSVISGKPVEEKTETDVADEQPLPSTKSRKSYSMVNMIAISCLTLLLLRRFAY